MRLKSVLACGLTCLGLAGCAYGGWREGGRQKSDNTFTYISTSYQPKTIIVTDPRTGEELWSMEIPVGKQLTIAFKENREARGTARPYLMKWAVQDAGQMTGTLDQQMPVPGPDGVHVEMVVRDEPEVQ